MVQRDQLGELFIPITTDTRGLNRELDGVKNRLNNTARGMRDTGKRMSAAVTLPIVGAAGAVTKMASDWESSFTGIVKTVDATEPELQKLGQGFRDMAKEIPVSVNELNRIGESAGQLGIETKNILSFSRTMADLGVATNMASDEAATSLARLANITGMPQTQFDRLGSTVVDLGNNLATTESEIVDMGLRLAAAGNQVGLTEHQVLSMAGAMSSVGIRAEAGGTAMSRVMMEMQTDVGNAGRELEVLADVAGMSTSQFAKVFKEDASAAIIAFTQGLGRMNESGQNVSPVLAELGFDTIRVRDTLLRAAGSGNLFSEAMETGSKAWQENSALTKEAETRYDTFASQMQVVKNRLQDVAITIGIPLMRAFKNAIQAAEPLLKGIERVAEAFANLSPKIQLGIFAFAGIAAAMGPVLIAIGLMIPAITGIATVIGIVLSPIALLIGAVVALGIAFVKNFEAIKNTVRPAVEWIGDKIGVDIPGIFRDASTEIRQLWHDVTSLLKEGEYRQALGAIGSFTNDILGGRGILQAYRTARTEIQTLWGEVVSLLQQGEYQAALGAIGSATTDALSGAYDHIRQWISQNTLVLDIAKGIVGGETESLGSRLATAILGAAVRAIEALAALRDRIMGWLDTNDVRGAIVNAFTGGDGPSLGEQIGSSIMSAHERVSGALVSLSGAVTEWRDANNPAQQIADAWKGEGGPSIGERIGDFITEDIPKIWDALGDLVSGIGDWLANNVDKVIGFAATFVVKWFGKWRTIVTDLIPWALATLSDFAPQILAKFDEWLPKVVQGGKDFVANLQRDLTDAWNTSVTALADIWTQLEPRINEAMESVRPGIEAQGKTWLQGYMDTLANFFSGLMPDFSGSLSESVRGALPAIGDAIRGHISGLTTAIEDMLNGIDNEKLIDDFFRGMAGVIREAIPILGVAFKEIGKTVITLWKELPGLVASIVWFAVRTMFNIAKSAIKNLFFLVRNVFEDMWEDLWGQASQPVKDFVKEATRIINNFIRGFNKIRIKLPGWDAKKIAGFTVVPAFGGFDLGVPQIPTLDTGGVVEGPGLFAVGPGVREIVREPEDDALSSGRPTIHVDNHFYGATDPYEQQHEARLSMRRLAWESGIG